MWEEATAWEERREGDVEEDVCTVVLLVDTVDGNLKPCLCFDIRRLMEYFHGKQKTR